MPSGQTGDLEKNARGVSNNGHGRFKPTLDDDACFKLWNMYISQAQDYDKALLEGWKSDMDGMMIFSALYSASLTAFIIESYQNLQDDPAEVTTTVLIQISQQLASLSNGTAVTFQAPPTFELTTTALVCNALWFLSLALALACSLLATFVQQWTRDFIHKTTMRPSPVVQARVLAFSYLGLRRLPSDLTLTEAMLEKSLQSSSDRNRQCMIYTMKSLNHDTELLPMLEAIPQAVLGPQGTVRLENYAIVAPLYQSSNPEENVISRITSFLSVSGRSANPTRQEKDVQTSLMALSSLACLAIEHTIRNPRSDHDPPVFWFDHKLLNIFKSSTVTKNHDHVSALALMRTSRLQSIKHCIDVVASQLTSVGTPARERLRMAKDTFGAVTLQDIHWKSEVFRQRFRELDSVLQDGCAPDVSESRAEDLVDNAKRLVSELRSNSRWKAALISVLGRFIGGVMKAKTIPVDTELTYRLICSIMPHVALFDQSLEVERDEGQESYAYDLFVPNPEVIPPEFFVMVMRLFAATKYPLSLPRWRENLESYFRRTTINQSTYILDQDVGSIYEDCILQDLRDNNATDPYACVLLIRGIYLGLRLHAWDHVAPRLRIFAKQVFELIPALSENFTREQLWPSRNAYTEWVLCKCVLNRLSDFTSHHLYLLYDGGPPPKSEILDDIRSLGQRLFPNFSLPDRPSPCTADQHEEWAGKLETLVMSMNLSIAAKFIALSAEDYGNSFAFGDWRGMGLHLPFYSGRVFEGAQLQFAEGVRTLFSIAPWNQPEDSGPSYVFRTRVFYYSKDWSWLTDLKSARILSKAIKQHKEDGKFKGMVGYEQQLFDRCKEIIPRKAKQTPKPEPPDQVNDESGVGQSSTNVTLGETVQSSV
ncbi:hypothetical protein VKT23_007310 [Stygiomarasmius scandens]|uniref:DUF6535 domain-containing protein n=1 Tax=Marasmiellus scandens TaxID=2682957 RepID=A0ABR1JMR5_9AGAR